MTDRAALLLADTLAGPETLTNVLDEYERATGPLSRLPAPHAGRRVLMVGLGSSRFAALDAVGDLRSAGVPAWAEYAPGVTTPPSRDLVLVAISASGATAEVIEAAERHRGTSSVIAVSNRPDGPLGAMSDVVLPLAAGVEGSGISTRTYLATNAVLALLGGALGGRAVTPDALRPAVDVLRRTLEARDGWLEAASEVLDGAEQIDVIGPASDRGLVAQAALMLREAPRLRASAHDTRDWLHTAIYTALPGHRALLFDDPPVTTRVLETIHGRGGTSLHVGPGRNVDPGLPRDADRAVRRLVLGSVAELVASALWRRTHGEVKAT